MSTPKRSSRRTPEEEKPKRSSRQTPEEEKPNYRLITTIIATVGVVVAAIISYFGSVNQVILPIEATKTAEAFHTSVAMTQMAESKITATNIFSPVPSSPTLTSEPTATPNVPIVLDYPTPQQIPTQDYSQLFPQLDKTSTPSKDFPFVVIKFPSAGKYEILTKAYRSVLMLDINSSTLNQTILLPPGEYIVVMLPSGFSSLEEFIKYSNGGPQVCNDLSCDPPVPGFWEITVPSK